MRGPSPVALVVGLGLGFSLALGAQGTTDMLRGTVRSADGIAVASAAVSALSVTNRTMRSTQTDRNGKFTLPFPDGGGAYLVSYVAIGYEPVTREVKRFADEAILLADATLTRAPITLVAISVEARRQTVERGDLANSVDVGGNVAYTSTGLTVLPLSQVGEIAAMMSALPGVSYIPGSDGLPGGYSILGLPADQNNVLLNGVTVSALTVPSGVGTRLVSTSYDPARGGFSGGQTALATSSGSNIQSRSLSFNAQDPRLQWTDAAGEQLGTQAQTVTANGQMAGRIIPDHLFYNLNASFNQTASGLHTPLNTDAVGLQRSGIALDSVDRFVRLLSAAGIPLTVADIPARAYRRNASAAATMNFNPVGTHFYALTALGGFGSTAPAAGGAFSPETPAHGGVQSRWNASMQAQHSAYVRGFLTETVGTLTGSDNASSPFVALPEGRMRINSDFADGTSGVSNLWFGGSSSLQASGGTRSASVLNALSWYSWNNKHRVRLTTEFRSDDFSSSSNANRLGTFSYNSLAEFADDTPAAFTRRLTSTDRSGAQTVTGLSLGDAYRPTTDLQMQYGFRVDANRFATAPSRNPALESTFGVRNDQVPERIYISPRFGFQYTFGEARWFAVGNEGFASGPRNVLRGGIGDFRSVLPTNVISSAVDYTGLPGGVQQLACAGAAVPLPDWAGFMVDPSLIPDRCADGTTGSLFASALPSVAMFDQRFSAPHSIRSNLAYTGLLFGRLNASLEFTYSRNRNQPGTIDLNFNPERRFALAGESGRPVYVLPASIAPATGSIASRDARVSQQFSAVNLRTSNLESGSRQLSVFITPFFVQARRFMWNLAYVNQYNRDRYTGFGGTTAGNPLEEHWGIGGSARHAIHYGAIVSLFQRGLNLRVNGRVISGMAYTPMVSGDINGDGQSNDRAFVFDPATTADAVTASAIASLLNSASGPVRKCLSAQIGRVAGRNSCRSPWTTSMSASMSVDGYRLHLPRRLSPTLSISNPLTGLDALLHGSERMHGWGQAPVGDSRLLFVRGFDTLAQAYRYDVNPRFGETRHARTGMTSPMSVTLSFSMDVGPEPERQNFRELLGRGRDREGTRLTESLLRASVLSEGIGNPLLSVLLRARTLGLTRQEADSLATLNRAFVLASDSIWTPVVQYLVALPEKFDKEESWARYKEARLRQLDVLIRLAPLVTAQLDLGQMRKLPPFVAAYLDGSSLRRMRASGLLYGYSGGTFNY